MARVLFAARLTPRLARAPFDPRGVTTSAVDGSGIDATGEANVDEQSDAQGPAFAGLLKPTCAVIQSLYQMSTHGAKPISAGRRLGPKRTHCADLSSGTAYRKHGANKSGLSPNADLGEYPLKLGAPSADADAFALYGVSERHASDNRCGETSLAG